MSASLKKNFVVVLLRNISLLVFPLITFPYLSRVLEPENMGKVNFASALAAYFGIFAALGIPMYGTREIAKVRNDREKASKLANEFFMINLIALTVVLAVYIPLVIFVPKLCKENILYIITGFSIVIGVMNIGWLYGGYEKFVYTTVRGFVFQFLFVITIFCVVKEKNDYYLVPGILAVYGFAELLLNYYFSKNYVSLFRFKNLNLKRHMKSIFIIFFATIASSIYVNLDMIMLGFISGDTSVGFYNAAIRLNRVFVGLLVGVGSIFIPRLSYFYNNKLEEEGKRISQKWEGLLGLFVFPLLIGLFVLAKDCVVLLAGDAYQSAAITSQIMVPILFFTVFTNYFGVQLYSTNNEKSVSKIIILGAFIAVILNAVFIPLFKENGAAVTIVIVEGAVFFMHLFVFRKKLNSNLNIKLMTKYFIVAVIMGTVILIISKFLAGNIFIRLSICFAIGVITYGGILALIKDKLLLEIISIIFKKIGRK